MRDFGLDAEGGSATATPPVRRRGNPQEAIDASLGRRDHGSDRSAGRLRVIGLDDAEPIDLIRALEELKCAAEGAQAEVTADFDRSQRDGRGAARVPAERQGRGIAHQIALARRESPHRGQRHVGLAKILATELPCTRAALRSGRITEWKAMLLARETACLSLEHRTDGRRGDRRRPRQDRGDGRP